MTVEELNVIVSANKDDFDRKIRMVNENLVNVKKQAEDTSAGTLSAFKTLATGLSALGIAHFFKEANDSYKVQMENELKLETIMKQRMGATDAEITQVKELASAQQQIGIIGDEVQLAGAQQIATFATQESTVKRLIPAMNNLLAQQNGYNSTTGDAVSIGNLMGKVLQGQTSALTRVGITFSEAQENILKYGTEEQKAATLAQVITDNVGDMNEALRNTPTGQMTALNNDIGDIKEQVGATLQPLISSIVPVVSDLLTFSEPVLNMLNEAMKSTAAMLDDIRTKVEAATPAQQTMLKIAIGMAVAIPAVTAATRLMRAAKLAYTGVLNILIPKQLTYASALKATMGWIGIIVGALALLGIATNKGTEGIDDNSEKLKKENEAANKAAKGVDDVAESTDNLTDSVKRSLAGFDELNRLSGNSGTLASSVVSSDDVENAEGLADALSDVQEQTKNIDLGSLSFDIDFSNIWGEVDKLWGKLKSGEIGNSIKTMFKNLSIELKPFLDGIDEVLGTDLDKWLGDVGTFIGDIVTDLSNGDIDKAIDDLFSFVENAFVELTPSITTICSKILGKVDELLGTSFQKSFDKCAELCYQAGVMLNNVINDTAGKTERSQKYNNTYSEMLTYMRDWMVKNDSTSADDAYGETVSHFNVNNDEELKKWFNEGNYGASLYEFAKTTAMQIKNDEVDPVLKRRLKGQATWADISSLGILGYADGGFPDYGDLFIANERGPELVGTIGNRTAVANTSTIETAIYNAVRSAMSDSTGGQSADIHVTVDIDGDTVGETVARYNAVRNRRLNGRS